MGRRRLGIACAATVRIATLKPAQLGSFAHAGIACDEKTRHPGVPRFGHESIQLAVQESTHVVLDEQILLDHLDARAGIGLDQRLQLGVDVFE
jgi:hypothetical protein